MADSTTEMVLRIKTEAGQSGKELDSLARKSDDLGASLDRTQKKSKGLKGSFSDMIPSKAAMSMAAAGAAMVVLERGVSLLVAKESKLAEFSAITGVTGAELKKFGEAATDLSNQFGTSAVDNIEAFKGVLSRLGPDFASSSEAVKLMGENINTLALASGLDAATSMDALTTAMLQFGVDLSDPMKAAKEASDMMNIMAAGAKEGAAEVPQIAEALQNVGLTAKSLNVSFLETNVLIQRLATGGKTGAEAGVALRNVLTSLVSVTKPGAEALAKMGKGADDLAKTLTTKGANAALVELKKGLEKLEGPAERNAALVKLFGKENLAAAQALLATTDASDKLTKAMSGTNVAQDQANTMLDTTEAKWNRFSAFLDNTLVKSLEKAKEFLGSIFSTLESLGNLDLKKAGDDMTSGLKSIASYSTLGVSDAVLGWMGLGDEAEKAGKKVQQANQGGGGTKHKDGDVSPDGLSVWKNGKWELIKTKPTGGGGGGGRRVTKKATADKDKYEVQSYTELVEKQREELLLLMEAFGMVTDQTKLFDLRLSNLAVTASGEIVENIQSIGEAWYEAEAAGEAAGDAFQKIFATVGSAIGGEVDAVRDGLRSVLLSLLDFIEAEFVAAGAAVALRALISGGFSLFMDSAGYVAAAAGLAVARGVIGSFRTGIDYVPRDAMPAVLHKGEKVLTEDEADRYRKGKSGSGTKDIKIHFVAFESAIEGNNARTSRRYS